MSNVPVHTPILVLIVLGAGIALSLAVFTIAGNHLVLWGSGARVHVNGFDIMVNPATMLSYITLDIVNTGGRPLAACTARLLSPPVNIDDMTPSYPLRAGQTGTFYEARVSGLSPSDIYQAEVVCVADDGSVAVDKRSGRARI
ncbi:MAG: hypothetical protein QXD32_07655 [Nitrososphaerota archaeon]